MLRSKVSTIITAHNRPQFLKEISLPSVLSQNYPDFECIIVDDSFDNAVSKVVAEFQKNDARIKYFKIAPDQELGAALVYGITHAEGEYIGFLDDDNGYQPDFMTQCVAKLNELPKEFGGVTTGAIVVYGDHREYAVPSMSNSFYIPIGDCWLLKREVFFDKGILPDARLTADYDADLGIRFFEHYKAFIIEEPLNIRYAWKKSFGKHLHATSPSEKRLRNQEIYFDKNLPIFQARANKSELSFFYRTAGRNYCLVGKASRGLPLLWQAFINKPGARGLLNVLAALLGSRVYKFYFALEAEARHFVLSHFVNRVPLKYKKLTA